MPHLISQARAAPSQSPSSIRRLFSQDGMTVSLHAQNIGAGEWILRIYGAQGQTSEWMQCFDSALEAFAAGMAAIQCEGIEHFYADPVFAHLHAEAEL